MDQLRFSRRDALRLPVALATGACGLRLLPAAAQDAVPYLIAEKTTSPLLGPGGAQTAHWHFRTQESLPLLRAKQGVESRFRLVNKLDEEVWLHFFGVRGAADVMTVQLQPGDDAAREIAFTPPDAGTFWFGPLVAASRQRAMGLSGMLVVEEAEAGVAARYADVPLILADWKLADDGVLLEGFGDLEAAAGEGRLGNWFTVNGQYKPSFALPAGKPVRLRLLNVANTRTMNVTFKGLELAVLSRDGQPVKPSPVGPEALAIAPGQRLDLLVLSADAQATLALDLFEDVVEAAFFTGAGVSRVEDMAALSLPANPLPAVDATATPRAVPLVLEGGLKGGLKSARVGNQELDLRGLVEKGLVWAMNGKAGPGGEPLFEARRGELLVIAIDNRTTFEQPLHLQGHVWHPLEQDGTVVTGGSWRDTAVVPGLTAAKYLMVADNPGHWAVQSLVAERCDSGLLGAFTVSDMP